jgi:flavin reductase (DIM6/NTAB) family NADH-FMN oxidoreductase RutF
MTDQYRPLKNAFGRFATGIAIAACKKEAGGFAAITINSFTSVSLDPPLVLWCIENRASAYPDFMAADSYSVSILSAKQKAWSERFARYDPESLSEQEVEIWETGSPLLKDRLAGFDCRIATRHKAGDHVILIGEIVRFNSVEDAPLVYFASNYFAGFDEK